MRWLAVLVLVGCGGTVAKTRDVQDLGGDAGVAADAGQGVDAGAEDSDAGYVADCEAALADAGDPHGCLTPCDNAMTCCEEYVGIEALPYQQGCLADGGDPWTCGLLLNSVAQVGDQACYNALTDCEAACGWHSDAGDL